VATSLEQLLTLAKTVQNSARETILPPSETVAPTVSAVLPASLLRGTRTYIERVAHQVNLTYTATCYDACAVMARRLLEVLLIEAFDATGRADLIKSQAGDYFYLSDLIVVALDQRDWSLGKRARQGLEKLKLLGDQSAHSRRFNARREYIDENTPHLRAVVEELLYISKLRN
jgi:hypothetical protein